MKKIEVPISEEELQRMLHEDEEFHWEFDDVKVHLFKEDV